MGEGGPAEFTPAEARRLARLLRSAAGDAITAKDGAEQALLDRAVAIGLVIPTSNNCDS